VYITVSMRTRHLLDLSKNKITVELKWNVKCDIKKSLLQINR